LSSKIILIGSSAEPCQLPEIYLSSRANKAAYHFHEAVELLGALLPAPRLEVEDVDTVGAGARAGMCSLLLFLATPPVGCVRDSVNNDSGTHIIHIILTLSTVHRLRHLLPSAMDVPNLWMKHQATAAVLGP